jgi:hypothetical protein
MLLFSSLYGDGTAAAGLDDDELAEKLRQDALEVGACILCMQCYGLVGGSQSSGQHMPQL